MFPFDGVIMNTFGILLSKRLQQSNDMQYDGKLQRIQTVIGRHTECVLRPVTRRDNWNVPVREHSRVLNCFLSYPEKF